MITLFSITFLPNLSSSFSIFSILLYQLDDKRDTNSKKYQSPKNREMSFSPLWVISRKTFQVLPHSENWRCLNDSFAGRSQRMVTEVNLIDKLHTDLGNYLLCKRLILHANMEIYCSFKSFAGGTWGFSYREDRSCTSQVVPWHSCKIDISSHVRSCKFSDS